MSSLRKKKRRQCLRKIKYSNQTQAVAALISMKRDKIWNNHHTYKCNFGNHWHIGRSKLIRK